MVKYVAMSSALKISGTQKRILARYLFEHLGNRFSPTQMAIRELTKGHADISLVGNCGLIMAKISRGQLSGGRK